MFEYGILPPAMFLGMIIFMLYGFPVAFSLASVGLLFGVIGIFTEHFSPAFMQALPLRIFGIISNDLLLAIPFFTFMGQSWNVRPCGGFAGGHGQALRRDPGGLAYAVILVGAILGAITGTVAASVITMGVISLPIMLKYGYNPRVATGVIAASAPSRRLFRPLSFSSFSPTSSAVPSAICISAPSARPSCRSQSSCSSSSFSRSSGRRMFPHFRRKPVES